MLNLIEQMEQENHAKDLRLNEQGQILNALYKLILLFDDKVIEKQTELLRYELADILRYRSAHLLPEPNMQNIMMFETLEQQAINKTANWAYEVAQKLIAAP
jgi:hypothetical protein